MGRIAENQEWKWNGYSDRKDNSRRCPKNLHKIDIGKEFYNANVQKLLKKHNINHYSTYSIMKTSVGLIVRWKTIWGNHLYIEIINGSTCYRVLCLSTSHESIELSICGPSIWYFHDCWLLNTMYSNVKAVALPRFKMDDSIRVSKFKTIFEKVILQIGPQ